METEEDSELSSSSGSCSSSGEDSVEEEDEDSREEEVLSEPNRREQDGRERRKRKRKVTGQRRELRSKYESVQDFNPEARSAQTEELERIRRLELQRSLQLQSAAAAQVCTEREASPDDLAPGDRAPVILNLAQDERRHRVEAIVISSDSEEDEGDIVERRRSVSIEEVRQRGQQLPASGSVKREVREGEGGGRYDVVGLGGQERVVINLGHKTEEEDVLLAPQIGRIIKPHQVC